MIECVGQDNLEEVLPLIRQYQAFYSVTDISDSRNREFFAQFGEHSEKGCQFLYRKVDENNKAKEAVAFATVYFTYISTIASKVAVLNDLFTLPTERGQGVGRKLIEQCRVFAGEKGASRLQWATSLDNTVAQSLYDAMDTKKMTWHFYTYPV